MGTRRIVTGTDADGRSYFASDDTPPGAAGFGELWQCDGADPLSPLPSDGGPPVRLEPPPGGSTWRVFDLPPDEVVAASREPERPRGGGERLPPHRHARLRDGARR